MSLSVCNDYFFLRWFKCSSHHVHTTSLLCEMIQVLFFSNPRNVSSPSDGLSPYLIIVKRHVFFLRRCKSSPHQFLTAHLLCLKRCNSSSHQHQPASFLLCMVSLLNSWVPQNICFLSGATCHHISVPHTICSLLGGRSPHLISTKTTPLFEYISFKHIFFLVNGPNFWFHQVDTSCFSAVLTNFRTQKILASCDSHTYLLSDTCPWPFQSASSSHVLSAIA